MKQLLLLLSVLVSFTSAFGQPASDACSNATNITPVTSCGATSANLQNATVSAPTNTQGTTYDAWYRFTTPAGVSSVNITIPTSGSGLSSVNFFVEAFSAGSCPFTTGNSLGTANESTGLSLTGLASNTEYYFRVFSTTNPTGNPANQWNYSVCVSYTAVLANDLCTNATNLTSVTSCGATTNQTVLNATATGSPTNGAGTTRDVWYTFTTPANIRNAQIAVTGLGTNLTVNNTFIEAFTSSNCAAGVFTGTSIGTTASGGPLTLSLTNLAPSTQYYFRVFTTGSATGGTSTDWGFSICVSHTAVPANDNCAGAVILTAGTVNNAGTVQNASASSETIGCASGTPDDDVWYRFTTGTTQRYATITLTPGATLNANGAMIQLYSGACGSLTSIACGQNELTVNTGLQPSTQYYIRVYSSAAYSTTPAVGTTTNSFSILVSSPSNANIAAGKTNEVYRQTILSPANVLADPWEVTYGPDNMLWITEAKGYKVNRMNPVTGARQVVLDVSQGSTFLPAPDQTFNAQFDITVNNPQGGFAGLALHPNFTGAAGGQNFVYVSYVHTHLGGIAYRNRIVRFTYNVSTNRLESPVSVCDTLPGSGDHNSQRMIIAPMTQGGSDYYLFYASGDMGAGQQFPTSANITRPMKSQVVNSYEGKILRFGLSDTCGGSGLDAWIPASNPYNNVSPVTGKSAVWNIGQRNNQGFAYHPALNILYGASHGPFSDDEINIIEGFKNYGHPRVIGYAADGNYNGTTTPGLSTSTSAGVSFGWTGGAYTVDGQAAAAGTCLPVGNEVTNMNTINASAATYGAYRDPIYSAYPATNPGDLTVSSIWSNPTTPGNSGWHSEGWSGLGVYTSNTIPGWKNTLLAAGLKWGRTIRLKLNDAGTAVVKTIPSLPSPQGDTVTFFQSDNRYRDMAFSPNGRDIFLTMDRSAAGSAATVGNPPATVASCRGCVVRYEFLGYNPTGTSPFPSTIPDYIPVDSSTNPGCVTATAVTINADNGNNNLWVPITGPNGNIIAEIDANGNDLGNITTSFFTRTGAPSRSSSNNSKYLNRNITINVQSQPSTPVGVRLYITGKELADIIATPGSNVTTINDLGVFKNNDGCGTAIASTATGQTIAGRYVQSTFGHALQFNVSSFSSFYFFSTTTTLPFELFTFTGKAVNNASKLEWVVNSQSDVLSYSVERSIDNSNFEEIGVVSAKDGNGNITYNFTDFNAGNLGTVLYYRIRSNETTGTGKYTNTISINFTVAQLTSVNLFPNPVTNKTNVLINAVADEIAQLKIVDNTGRIIRMMPVRLVKGRNNIILDMSNLGSGLYYIDISGKAINEKSKLIKK
jgi:trimeric autotransporter adhesin